MVSFIGTKYCARCVKRCARRVKHFSQRAQRKRHVRNASSQQQKFQENRTLDGQFYIIPFSLGSLLNQSQQTPTFFFHFIGLLLIILMIITYQMKNSMDQQFG
jgi:hypothetical protein